jgi:hypothetical protein
MSVSWAASLGAEQLIKRYLVRAQTVARVSNSIGAFGAAACLVLVAFVPCDRRNWAVALVIMSIGFVGFYTPGSTTSMVHAHTLAHKTISCRLRSLLPTQVQSCRFNVLHRECALSGSAPQCTRVLWSERLCQFISILSRRMKKIFLTLVLNLRNILPSPLILV